jgi:hypothetical protein
VGFSTSEGITSELGSDRSESAAEQDSTVRIGRRKMYYSVVSAEYVDEYRIRVTFEDGHSGVADLKSYISKGGVFSRFTDPLFFRRFQINRDFGAICWGEDVDIAPESLYRQVVENRTATRVAEDGPQYGYSNMTDI